MMNKRIMIGNFSFIVLDNFGDRLLCLAEKILVTMGFDSESNIFDGSEVDELLNEFLYNQLKNDADFVSLKETGLSEKHFGLLTEEMYKRYREKVKSEGYWWWLSTQADNPDDDRKYITCVTETGDTYPAVCTNNQIGVRPVCMIKKNSTAANIIKLSLAKN